MIQGRYVKDCSYTEIYRGNGITEIIPADQGLQYFWWPHEVVKVEVKKKRRDWIWWTVGAAVFLMGASLGAIVQNMYYCIPLFIASLAYIALVIWANRR